MNYESMNHGQTITVPAPPVFFAGLDLGQSNDPAALSLIGRKDGTEPPEGAPRLTNSKTPLCTYECTYLERFPLGTSYTEIARYVVDFMRQESIKGKAELILDAGGVGRAFTNILRDLGLKFIPATITSGANVKFQDGLTYLPKRELVGTARIILDARRFKFAQQSPESATLVHEMQSYKVKVTDARNDTYAAGRESDHDDLLFAAMLAMWRGEWQEKRRLNPPKPAQPAVVLEVDKSFW